LAIPFRIFGLLLPKTFKLFGFPIFLYWAYMMKVIPETRRVQEIWYLRFYFVLLWCHRVEGHVQLFQWASTITKRVDLVQGGKSSSSFHWNVSCSRHDIAKETLDNYRMLTMVKISCLSKPENNKTYMRLDSWIWVDSHIW
jgi:hypothetical protein